MAVSDSLPPILNGLPVKPGCYIMKSPDGAVIYVGKAINLRSRVRSYFQPGADHGRKVAELVAHVADIEWIVVGSELEALILEMNLIKRHRPKYNVRLKDDKRYPYIQVRWGDAFPTVLITRRMVDDGSRYFGPYTSVWAVHETLDVLRRIFPYLTCDRVITGQDTRACLYADIKLCLAPCIGAVDQAAYRQMIDDLCRFLQGETEAVVVRLREDMRLASEAMAFERAAARRDQLQAIDRVVEGQKIVSQDRVDSDVIAFARDDDIACVQVFFVRGGKLIGREYFVLEGTREAEDREVVEGFVKQFYAEAAFIPERVLLPTEIEEARIVEEWLRQKRGGPDVQIQVPRSGPGHDLIGMAAENAAETLAMLRARWESDRSKHVAALAQLQQALEEVLDRRFKRWSLASEEVRKPGGKLDAAFGRLPDLLIVDGGKGQMGRAVQVLENHGLSVRVAGLAKGHEELYLPGREESLVLERRSEGLYLIQRIRDEAHRFALGQHRVQRAKAGVASQLDAIAGIGPRRRKALLAVFGDLNRIRGASVGDLTSVQGITRDLAERIKAEL
jgi:excinuclease ABC subunit C